MRLPYIFLIMLTSLVLFTCGNSDSDSSSLKFKNFPAYVGEWLQNGTSGNMKEVRQLEITEQKAFSIFIKAYASTSKLEAELDYQKEFEGVITAIETNENNAAYDSLFIDVIEISYTPKTPDQVAQWNSNAFGGETDWEVDITKTFDEENIGEGESYTIWQENVLIASKFEGELLILRDRAEFDGDDPPEEIYFRED